MQMRNIHFEDVRDLVGERKRHGLIIFMKIVMKDLLVLVVGMKVVRRVLVLYCPLLSFISMSGESEIWTNISGVL
mgnify:CR=1 FL=1